MFMMVLMEISSNESATEEQQCIASREAKTELLVCVLDQVIGSSEHTVIEDRQCTTSTCGVRMPQLRQRQWRRPVVVIQDG